MLLRRIDLLKPGDMVLFRAPGGGTAAAWEVRSLYPKQGRWGVALGSAEFTAELTASPSDLIEVVAVFMVHRDERETPYRQEPDGTPGQIGHA